MNRQVVLARVAPVTLRALAATWRYAEILPDGTRSPARHQLAPAVYALWHGDLLPLAMRYAPTGLGTMISQHGDGSIAARVVSDLGARVVRGSSSSRGAGALQEMARLGNEGVPLAITTDGPRGPARVSKPGVVRIAALSGLPIVPVSAAGAGEWRAGSWDAFRVPLPFARVLVAFGEDIPVSRDVSKEDLSAVAKRLDAELGVLRERLGTPS